jgi:glycosyltransferase involved in cell wall biosynthesis
MSGLISDLRLELNCPGWQVQTTERGIELTPNGKLKHRWYELVLNSFESPLPLIAPVLEVRDPQEPDRTIELISFVVQGHRAWRIVQTPIPESALLRVRMDWKQVGIRQFALQVRPRSNFSATMAIMRFISQQDRLRGLDPWRVYRKSLARWRRHGSDGFEHRLLKEYRRVDPHLMPEEMRYQAWIEQHESPALDTFSKRCEALTRRPFMSVIITAYKSHLPWLIDAVRSVKEQAYANWEVWIVDDGSESAELDALLREMATLDHRIHPLLRSERGRVSLARNSGLEACRGDYVTFMDHDDLLAPNALLEVAELLQNDPQPLLIYGDEDRIDEQGRRVQAQFKPEWNQDLLYSQDYIGHYFVVERQLLKRCGGFQSGYEGSHGHDLLLRLSHHLQAAQVRHVPKVLYHVRKHTLTITGNETARLYTVNSSINALKAHFAAHGSDGVTIERGVVRNTFRIRHPLPDPPPKVSLLVPSRDQLDLLRNCITSILEKTDYPDYEIIILDNASRDPQTLAWLKQVAQQHPQVQVRRFPLEFNYSAINNFGASYASGQVLGLINNDVEVINSEWLIEMVSQACRPEIGCVGAKLLYADGTVQHAGVVLGISGVAGHPHRNQLATEPGYLGRLQVAQNFSAVTGACMVVRKSVFDEVGGLNPAFEVVFNDIDFCLRVLSAGYRNLWTPWAQLYHYESKSRGMDDTPDKQARFRREIELMHSEWSDYLTKDPAYNPNLTRMREDFALRL